MTGYMVVFAAVSDDTQFARYVEALQPILRDHDAVPLARSENPVVLEGEWGWQTAGILRFPSVEAAVRMWESEAYTQAKRLRAEVARFSVVVVGAPS
jgi:uncharacterized protein (DUF1330 family)